MLRVFLGEEEEFLLPYGGKSLPRLDKARVEAIRVMLGKDFETLISLDTHSAKP